MKTRSAKAKGRRLARLVAETIQARFGLQPADVTVTPAGVNGPDIGLASAAADRLPLAIECKNQERLNIWQALDQAEANAGELTPAVIFKRNRSRVYVAMELEQFLDLLEGEPCRDQ